MTHSVLIPRAVTSPGTVILPPGGAEGVLALEDATEDDASPFFSGDNFPPNSYNIGTIYVKVKTVMVLTRQQTPCECITIFYGIIPNGSKNQIKQLQM